MLIERSHTEMEHLNESQVTLDVGGRYFATSTKTLLSDKDSIFNTMLTAGVHHS